MEQKGTQVLETRRLILRPWRESDAEAAFAGWMNDPDVTHFLTWMPHGDISLTRSRLKAREEECKRPDVYHWAVVWKDGNVLIGDLEAGTIDPYQQTGGLGYCLSKAWWGKGIMTEALTEVLRYCFEEVGAARISGSHATANVGSGRVMEKCGLRYEGTRRKAFRLLSTGEWVDIVDRAILREDYFHGKCP